MNGSVIPVVGNNLILTPICIIACIKIRLTHPTKTNFVFSSFSKFTFLNTEKTRIIKKIKIKIMAIIPNSSEITEII